jgi:hypothetical protein
VNLDSLVDQQRELPAVTVILLLAALDELKPPASTIAVANQRFPE